MTPVDAVADLVGVEWVRGGRSSAGLDCLGVVLVGAQRLGLHPADPWHMLEAGWSEGERPSPTLPAQEGWRCVAADSVLESRLLPGDMLAICGHGGIEHVALYVGGGRVLDSRERVGVHLAWFAALQPLTHSAWRWSP